MTSPDADVSTNPAVSLCKTPGTSLLASTLNLMERLPSEILVMILSYLDASTLFCISHVNMRFCQLANDNAMWHKIYVSEFGRSQRWIPKCMNEALQSSGPVAVQHQSAGYWKRLYFKSIAGYDVTTWRRELRDISPHTGLPRQTEWVLRNLHVTWELTVSDESGCEDTFEPTRVQFFKSAVIVYWSGECWPKFHHISTLQLHGVMRVTPHRSDLKKPGWRSLLAKFDMKTAAFIGKDRLVRLMLLKPGIIIGIWRGQSSIAFVMISLHFHKLVEKSLLGSSVCPYYEPVDKPPFDDMDPKYGLHGYTLHIVLHNAATEIMCGHFSQLVCQKMLIRKGLIQLNAISRTNLLQHTPLSGSVTLPWRSEALQGTVENCCLMSMTLLDESQKPLWCVSSPVSMVRAKKPICCGYDGEGFLIPYYDSDGQVKMELVWVEEQKQLFLVNLAVYVALAKVNKHFSTDY